MIQFLASRNEVLEILQITMWPAEANRTIQGNLWFKRKFKPTHEATNTYMEKLENQLKLIKTIFSKTRTIKVSFSGTYKYVVISFNNVLAFAQKL